MPKNIQEEQAMTRAPSPTADAITDAEIIELAMKLKLYPMTGEVSGVELYQCGKIIEFSRALIARVTKETEK
jgi:hypothetical protein